MGKHAVLSALAALLLFGCDKEPTVNATGTEEEQRASVERVKDSLPDDQRSDFEEAMQALLFSEVDGLEDWTDSEGLARRLKDRIDGKTGSEIIAEGEQVIAERKERERQQTISEIRELAEKLDPAAEALCAKFVVQRSVFRRSGSGPWDTRPSINLVVSNETDHPISRAYFHALLLTPGRAVPWVDDEFQYAIPGGLEPGEVAEWSLRPNMFGSWTRVPDDRHDAVLIVRAVGLDGPDGESLTGERLTSFEKERLQTLLDSVEFDGAARIKESMESRSGMLEQWRDVATKRVTLDEIALLRQRRMAFENERHAYESAAEAAEEQLSEFVVERSRFYWKEGLLGDEPVIELTLRNGTDHAIGRFFAVGVLSSPEREKPWIEESFNYTVRGGLEPGETQQFKLAPTRYTEWGRAPKDRSDMIFTVTIERLEDADGNDLFQVEENEEVAWSDEDEARLAALQAIAAEQGWN